MGTERRPLRLFVSYAHADEALAGELLNHLKPLERRGWIAPWYDRHIPPGADWDGEIAAGLERADLVLFLLSSDFMASDYCNGVEVRRALERHAAGSALALPVFLRPVVLEDTPFAAIQGLPRDARAVTEWDNRDLAYREIARGIRRRVLERRGEGPLRVAWDGLPGPRERPGHWLAAALLALGLLTAVTWLFLPGQLQRAAERAYLREDWPAARTWNRWTLRLAPRSARAHWVAGLLAGRRGDDAEPHFRRALALEPDTPAYRIALAEQRIERGDPGQAVKLLQRLVEGRPELFLAGLHLAQALRALGRLEEAAYYQQRGTERLGQDAAWQRKENRGTWYFPTGLGRIGFDSREAKTALLRADLALTHTLAGNMTRAEADFRAAEGSGAAPLIFDNNVRGLLAWRIRKLQGSALVPIMAAEKGLEWSGHLDEFRRRFTIPVWPDTALQPESL